MCFGTFDIFHPWHIHYLSEAQKYGEKLIVIIARDHRVQSIKWAHPHDDEHIRREHVKKSFPDAVVILGDENDIFAPIDKYSPDILAFGYDQFVPQDIIMEKFPDISLVRIDGFETEKWKSSFLKKDKNKSI